MIFIRRKTSFFVRWHGVYNYRCLFCCICSFFITFRCFKRTRISPSCGLERQLILKGGCRVNPRSQLEFVVPAAPWPKQEFTDHTGQTSTRTTQSQSTSRDLFDQNTILAVLTSPKKGLSSFEMSFRCFALQNVAQRSWWFPLVPTDKHKDDDRCLMKTIKAPWIGKRCVKL